MKPNQFYCSFVTIGKFVNGPKTIESYRTRHSHTNIHTHTHTHTRNYTAVSRRILREASPYFDCLFRFNPSTDRTLIELEQPFNDERALLFVLDHSLKLAQVEHEYYMATCKHDEFVPFEQRQRKQHQHQQQCSLDLLFECIVLCSKYRFVECERHYSQLLVHSLAECGTSYKINDIIEPITIEYENEPSRMNDHSSRHYHSSSNYLSLVQIRHLARAYHLHYLHSALNALIRQRQAIFWQKLRTTYFGG